MNKQNALIQRMISNNPRTFDGGYSITGLDDALIYEALEEAQQVIDPEFRVKCPIVLMSYLVSENVKSVEEFRNCKNFIDDYVESVWGFTVGESDNPFVAEAVREEDL